MRSLERTRNLPILVIAEAEDNARLLRGLEIGVNDYLMRPIDKNELLARVRTQVRKKRYTERLRDNVQHVDRDGDHRCADRPATIAATWKAIWHAGRAGGVARQAAAAAGARHRLFQVDQRHLRPRRRRRRAARIRACASRKSIRGIDLACRYGGEEFVVVMPETDMAVAAMVAERLRRRIAGEPFRDPAGRAPPSTSRSRSALRRLRGADDSAATILKRADQALYRAKRDGRNRVVPDAA